jgi:hypothetical protein
MTTTRDTNHQPCCVLLAGSRRPDGSYEPTLISSECFNQDQARAEVERLNDWFAAAGRPAVAYYRLGDSQRWLGRNCRWVGA